MQLEIGGRVQKREGERGDLRERNIKREREKVKSQ